MANISLQQLISHIAEHFRFDDDKYPELRGSDDEKKRLFAIRHLAMHFAKITGQVVTAVEQSDHGRDIDIESFKAELSKSMITTLRLAELVGMTEVDFVKAIEEKYKATIE